MKKIIFLLFLALLSNSVFAEEISLKSDPAGAEVVIKDMTGAVAGKIGKTPLTRNLQELSAAYSKAGFFIISIEKEGYAPQSILASDLLKSDININVNLEPLQDMLNYRELDKSLNKVFEAQRLIRTQQYDEAIETLKKVEEEQKNLSVVPEMIGGAYYLKKDMKSALGWYRKAYRLNPENKDAFTMKAYLEKSIGSDSEKGK